MEITTMIYEDFTNYKLPSLFIGFPRCTFKCNKRFGRKVCQNMDLMDADHPDVPIDYIIDKYVNNTITKALVCGGLEPFDSFDDLFTLCSEFRKVTNDPIVIYTGYYPDEIEWCVTTLTKYINNVIIKYGRFIPDSEKRYEPILGVYLASDNQYAKEYL